MQICELFISIVFGAHFHGNGARVSMDIDCKNWQRDENSEKKKKKRATEVKLNMDVDISLNILMVVGYTE